MPAMITKSTFVDAAKCAKRVWFDRNEPAPETKTATFAKMGREIGGLAQRLFPGGVLIDALFDQDEARRQTACAMNQSQAPALFEAAFEFNGAAVRVDVLERCEDGAWNLIEVKASLGVKDSHLRDVAYQYAVLKRSGVDIARVTLMLIDRLYVRGDDDLELERLFRREDVTHKATEQFAVTSDETDSMLLMVASASPPPIESSKRCPRDCRYLERCFAQRPDDWIYYLPGLTTSRFDKFRNDGVERISTIPLGEKLTPPQERARDAWRSGGHRRAN